MRISKRLLCAAALCEGAQSAVDVGCDHAELAVYLVRHMGVPRVIASDVRPGPLSRARAAIERHGLCARISTVLCDGLSALSPDDADTVVLCGMGGHTITHILAASPWAMDGAHRLVLQPMSHAAHVRRFLAAHGCGIVHERLVAEKDKLYAVIAAGGPGDDGRAYHWLFTERMTGEPLFGDYLRRLIGKEEKAAPYRDRDGESAARLRMLRRMLEEREGAPCRSTH